MKIERFEIIDRCLFWKDKKMLIVGDLHLGYEDYLQERGWSFPKTQQEENERILNEIFKKIGKVEKILLLGDVKHFFGGILREEFSDFRNLIKIFERNLKENGKIVITKGNHDNILEPIAREFENVEILDYFFEENVVFFHGSLDLFEKLDVFLKNNKINLLVLGHYHPAITLKEKKGIKNEKYKCFLYGNSKKIKKDMIFVPSFFPLVEGSDVLNHHQIDYFEINNFEVFILDEIGNVYDFGKLKKLRY